MTTSPEPGPATVYALTRIRDAHANEILREVAERWAQRIEGAWRAMQEIQRQTGSGA